MQNRAGRRNSAIVIAAVVAAARAAWGVPAFPGAEGFGANSAGGRGGDVYHVTTLAADPSHTIPGSLTYGLYTKNVPAAGRTIVFDVGGTIDCSTGSITFKDIHNVTIAGQTAPGPGISIIGDTFGITGNDSSKPTHDITVRYLTVRKGTGNGDDAMHVQGTGGTHDVILDHISGSWSEDEVISSTQTATNVTVQNSIMSEALTSGHQYGSLIRPTVNSSVSYLRNLYSNQASRNPRPGTYNGMTLNFEFQNNVIYNWSDRAGYIAGADTDVQHLNMNYAGNYLVAGPSTADSSSNPARRETAFFKENNSDPLDIHVFQQGNLFDSTAGPKRDGADTGWNMFKQLTGSTVSNFADADKQATRFDFPQSSPDTADLAYQKVIANVGAFPFSRSDTDKRLINDVLNYTGSAPLVTPNATEWNNLVTNGDSANWTFRPANWDTDNDGMPNWWETIRGTNPNVADNNTVASNGYTNLENYINSIPFTATWTADGDVSTSSIMNWRGELPATPYATANFGSLITAARTLTVDTTLTMADMNFDSANSYTLGGTGTITLDAISGVTTINVITGSHTIAAPITLNRDLQITVTPSASTLTLSGNLAATGKTITKLGAGAAQFANVRANALNVSGGAVQIISNTIPNSATGTSILKSLSISSGTLDLTNNSLVIDYTTPGTLLADTRAALAAGRLTTSLSTKGHALGYADNSSLGAGSFGGQSVDGTSLLIEYTLKGDANLDGRVNGVDFNALASGFGGASGKVWVQGDFNYDGAVNTSDFTLMAANFGGSIGAAPIGALVPEPAALFALLCAGGLFISRRKRS
jgi:hypothetical protein